MINNIHDALLFVCKDSLIEEAKHEIEREMMRPNSRILDPDGNPFWCAVESKVGKTWSQK
jgi:DNA polymerase I-like protein with 3'-5' exonuclease and polymerase domains